MKRATGTASRRFEVPAALDAALSSDGVILSVRKEELLWTAELVGLALEASAPTLEATLLELASQLPAATGAKPFTAQRESSEALAALADLAPGTLCVRRSSEPEYGPMKATFVPDTSPNGPIAYGNSVAEAIDELASYFIALLRDS